MNYFRNWLTIWYVNSIKYEKIHRNSNITSKRRQNLTSWMFKVLYLLEKLTKSVRWPVFSIRNMPNEFKNDGQIASNMTKSIKIAKQTLDGRQNLASWMFKVQYFCRVVSVSITWFGILDIGLNEDLCRAIVRLRHVVRGGIASQGIVNPERMQCQSLLSEILIQQHSTRYWWTCICTFSAWIKNSFAIY